MTNDQFERLIRRLESLDLTLSKVATNGLLGLCLVAYSIFVHGCWS